LEKIKNILAVIPARGGSKGLPGKNIRMCAGKPLIVWSIEAAIHSKYIDKVLVSTDSKDIASIAKENGAWVPYLRDPDLARDDSTTTDVITDILNRMKDYSYSPELIVLLQPTSPLRTSEHIDEAIEKYFQSKKTDRDTLISTVKADQKIYWTMGVDPGTGYIHRLFDETQQKHRRQDFSECFMPNGAIYIAKTDGFTGFINDRVLYYLMDNKSSVDIDYEDDFEKAKMYLEKGYVKYD